MGDSMLVYSEKMRRISRNRFAHASSTPVQQTGSATKSKKRLALHDTADDTVQPGKPSRDTKRPVRSLSDAASYKSLRGRHLLKAKKKTSLDMTGADMNVESNKASGIGKDYRVISSAWESSDCLYQRQRRRGVTAVPNLDALVLQDHPDDGLKEFGTGGNSLPRINMSSGNVDTENLTYRRTPLGFVSETSPVSFDSDKELTLDDIKAERKCPEYSEISQIVLRSLAPDIADTRESLTSHFSDTSKAELDLLTRSRKRLSSSSAPTSPTQSSDEDDDERAIRHRTQSVSLPCKPLKSVLKKSNVFQQKKLLAGNSKTVSFTSPDTIRVISRCSGDEWEAPSVGEPCQSRSTIVVISD